MTSTPHSEHFDDIYFDEDNGLEESRYVFLQQNHLPQSWQDKSRFVICETGFGTGLNFLCAWTEFEKTTHPAQRLHYYSFEKFPLSATEIHKYLNHWAVDFDGRLEKLISVYPLRVGGWHTIRVSPQVTLTLIFDDVNRALPELRTHVDCWFLDGHAPAKNPDMWSEAVFQNIGRLSHAGTRCATFTAAGLVKRGLANAGFTVTKATGYGRKRDMTVGLFEQKSKPEPNHSTPQNIAVIGGGIAGAALIHSLTQRGAKVTVFEKSGLASGGSGNPIGLYNPRITMTRGFEADFYSPAFALGHQLFKHISKNDTIGFNGCGNLHAITDDQKEKRFHGFAENWGWHSDHVTLLNPEESSDISGVKLSHAALYLPDAGMVSPKKVTEFLAQSAQIVKSEVITLEQDNCSWLVNGQIFDAVILASGFDVLKLFPANDLPLQKIRGQITKVKVNDDFKALRKNLCYGGYSTLAIDGEAIIGSTFQHWIDNDELRPEDDSDNIKKLEAVAPALTKDMVITGGRASFRCAAKDRKPVIGKIDGFENLYISTAHGSHGILSSLMGAELLAADIFNEYQILPTSVEYGLSPSRFKKLN